MSRPEPTHARRPEPGLATEVSALIADTLRNGVAVDFAVSGTSMLPLLWPGDVLTVEPAGAAALERGQIALIVRDGRLIAHRVIGTRPLVTAGDFCPAPDGEVPPGGVLGRVVAFRRRGVRVRLDALFGRLLSLVCRHAAPRRLWRWRARGGGDYAVPDPGTSRMPST